MVHLLPNNTSFNETQQIMCFMHVKISRKIKTERKSVPNQSKPKSSWANPKLTHLNSSVVMGSGRKEKGNWVAKHT